MINPFPNTTWCSWNGLYPELIGDGHFIAEGARLIGDIQLQAQTSIWFNAVLRADNAPIHIGKGCNIQDSTVVHTDPGCPVMIGNYVSVGHRAILHGCTIESHSLIGMGAILMNHVYIGSRCIVAAGALLTEGFNAPEGSLILGVPARIARPLKAEEFALLDQNAENYILKAQKYRSAQELL